MMSNETEQNNLKTQSFITGVKDCNGDVLYLGDKVKLNNEGKHVKEECWYPVYEIIFTPPSFELKHIGGGDDVSYAHWLFSAGNCNRQQLELIERGHYYNSQMFQMNEASWLEDGLEKTIDERDKFHEWADKLAYAIASMLDEDIGEHSSNNSPWSNALKALEENLRSNRLERRKTQNRKLQKAYQLAPDCFQIQYHVGGNMWINCDDVHLLQNQHKRFRLLTKESMEIIDE